MNKLSQILTSNFYASELIEQNKSRSEEKMSKTFLVSLDIPKTNSVGPESPRRTRWTVFEFFRSIFRTSVCSRSVGSVTRNFYWAGSSNTNLGKCARRANGDETMQNSLNILHSGVVGRNRKWFGVKQSPHEQFYGASSPKKRSHAVLNNLYRKVYSTRTRFWPICIGKWCGTTFLGEVAP